MKKDWIWLALLWGGLIVGGIIGAAYNSARTEAACERRLWAWKETFWQELEKPPESEPLTDRKPVWEPHP